MTAALTPPSSQRAFGWEIQRNRSVELIERRKRRLSLPEISTALIGRIFPHRYRGPRAASRIFPDCGNLRGNRPPRSWATLSVIRNLGTLARGWRVVCRFNPGPPTC
jgi:hypothetical protein